MVPSLLFFFPLVNAVVAGITKRRQVISGVGASLYMMLHVVQLQESVIPVFTSESIVPAANGALVTVPLEGNLLLRGLDVSIMFGKLLLWTENVDTSR